MRKAIFPIHLTERDIRVLCEGIKLVQNNPASKDEHDTATRLLSYFEGTLAAAADPARKAYLVTERLRRLYIALEDQGKNGSDDWRKARELDDRIGSRWQLENDIEKAEELLSRLGF